MSSKKEWATQALATGDFGPMDVEYVEALAFDKLPQYYVDTFDFYKLYSDELPQGELVGEWHPSYPMMKCRGNVIFGIGMALSSAVSDGILKNEDELKVVNFYKKYDWKYLQGSKGKVWTTVAEIELINKTLDFVTQRIKSNFGVINREEEIGLKFQKELLERRKKYGRTQS